MVTHILLITVSENFHLSQTKLIMKRTVSSPCRISVIPLPPGYITPSAPFRNLSPCPTCFEPLQVARKLFKAVVEKEKVEN